MQTVKALDHKNAEDYLEGEKVALIKHEYVYGQVYGLCSGLIIITTAFRWLKRTR